MLPFWALPSLHYAELESCKSPYEMEYVPKQCILCILTGAYETGRSVLPPIFAMTFLFIQGFCNAVQKLLPVIFI